MSKMDDMRALREARYAATAQRTPRARVVPPSQASAPARTGKAAPPEPSGDELCGHRSMNGRTCTREQGHAAKSHRYS